MTNSTGAQAYPQQALWKSFLLHVTPGALVTIVFLLLKPVLDSTGYPPLLAFLLAILLIDIPFMLVVMLVEGKKLTGRYSLQGVVLYRERVPWMTFILVFVGVFVIVYILILLATPVSSYLASGIFSNLPAWVFLEEQGQYENYSRNILLVVFSLQLVLTGIVLPWIEELYFRSYLLPRISRYDFWAPLIGGLFFGMYHVWQWYTFLTVFLLGAALGYVVCWKKDIRLSIGLHVFANTLTRLMFLAAALTM